MIRLVEKGDIHSWTMSIIEPVLYTQNINLLLRDAETIASGSLYHRA